MDQAPRTSQPLVGTAHLNGDKSLSHRALIFAHLSGGDCHLNGLNEGQDVAHTQKALQTYTSGHIDLGNSGTSARLLTGLLATTPLTITGDESLSRRPMARVADPLRQMGAMIELSPQGTLPLSIQGSKPLSGITYTLPIPSAQIKSAILLAGLQAQGTTTIIEPIPSRDHTERLLTFLKFPFQHIGSRLSIQGGHRPEPFSLTIPKDPSAAAFWAVGASLVPESEVHIPNVLWNPYRYQAFQVLKRMGANIEVIPYSFDGPEAVVDLVIRHTPLKATNIDASEIPKLIDEIPILAIAAANAQGTSHFHGLGELRHKESNRLQAIIDGLTSCGVTALTQGDDLIIQGQSSIRGDCRLAFPHDHRMIMSFAILNLIAEKPIELTHPEGTNSSDPTFWKTLLTLTHQTDYAASKGNTHVTHHHH